MVLSVLLGIVVSMNESHIFRVASGMFNILQISWPQNQIQEANNLVYTATATPMQPASGPALANTVGVLARAMN